MKSFGKNIVIVGLAAVAGLAVGVFGVFRALELRKNYRLTQEDPTIADNRVLDKETIEAEEETSDQKFNLGVSSFSTDTYLPLRIIFFYDIM